MNRCVCTKGVARSGGFSVVELLLSMALLMVITAVFGRFFQRSTQSWESGMRTVETMISGRAAVNLITRDIERAVYDDHLDELYQSYFLPGLNLIVMRTQRERDSSEPDHDTCLVTYYEEGGELKRRVRLRGASGAAPPVTVIGEVVEFDYDLIDHGVSSGDHDLPDEIFVRLTLSNRYDDDESRYQEFVGRAYPSHRLRYPQSRTGE